MAFTKKNEEAVSPVIGVILMVAITVILAAVIAAFVFGMAGNVSKSKVVAATASRTGATSINVVYQGGPDNGDVSLISSSIDGSASATTLTKGQVGGRIHHTGTSGVKNQITATATFNDGTKQVILDTYV